MDNPIKTYAQYNDIHADAYSRKLYQIGYNNM